MRPNPAPLLALALALLAGPPPSPAADFAIEGGRVAFLGDSITQDGRFVGYLDAYLFTRFPGRRFELIKLGLSSETASGLTEPGHPYPRPDIHSRLARALKLSRPDHLAICYGMNDGIYAPADPGRSARYRDGIATVVAAGRAAGARVVVATPPPFDPNPIRDRLRPAGAAEYGYRHPFEGYDGVLAGYGDWILSKRADGWAVADIHNPSAAFLARARAAEPGYALAGDGVHPGADGHWLIARAYLDAWGAPADVDAATIDAPSGRATLGRVDRIERTGDMLSFDWTTNVPMPIDPAWSARLLADQRLDESINRQVLAIAGLPAGRHALFEGDRKLGEATAAEWAAGVNLAAWPGLSTRRRADELLPLAAERAAILGASWLAEVGHGPPDLPPAPPLAEATRKAAAIEAKVRALAAPSPIRLVLRPAGGD